MENSPPSKRQYPTLQIARDTPETADVRALLLRHFDLMRAGSPEESCHVMEPTALLDRGVMLFSARDNGKVLGVGALARLDDNHGELKSMHTSAEARGRGVARAILSALLDVARDQGLKRVSLETGTAEMFAPARALYLANGFVECPPFGDYASDPLSIFMTHTLGATCPATRPAA
ncbi:GNAT family N-acetyltransferase [Tateyamaria sp.]|uniref:GNAT family N-acetyltransferase n=1 Tax=Tateyamaria sp. TaxID=1929288 RepID=UPI00329B454B